MARFFVSFSVKDKEFVEKEVLRLIKAVGGEPWYAPDDIHPATDWSMELDNGLNFCDWFVLVMSENSLRSQWVLDEVNWAVTKRPGRILPIRIDGCSAETFNIRLMRVEFVDYREDNGHAQTKLISVLVNAIKSPVRSARSLNGKWEGRSYQEIGPKGIPINYPLHLLLTADGEHVTGTMTAEFPHPQEGTIPMEFLVEGEMSYERFLQLHYRSTNDSVIEFGGFISELNDLGNTMNGRFIGYGGISKRIISGRFEFQKKPEPSHPLVEENSENDSGIRLAFHQSTAGM
jgi:hypothetical protein